MQQEIQVQVSDEVVRAEGVASIPCVIPSFAKDWISVSHWQRSDGLILQKGLKSLRDHNHIRVLTDGSLFLEYVSNQDFQWKFRCFVKDSLSGDVIPSFSWARLIRNDANSKTAPRILTSVRDYRFPVGTNVEVGCSAQAFPVPSFSWSREQSLLMNLRNEKKTSLHHSSTGIKESFATTHSSQRSFPSSLSSSSSLDFLTEQKGNQHILRHDDNHHNDALRSVDSKHLSSSLRGLNVMSNQPILSIPNAQTEDSGVYDCTTNNSLGEDRKSFRIIITGEMHDICMTLFDERPNSCLRKIMIEELVLD